MERKGIICLFLFVVLVLVLSSCHPRRFSDIKPNMTKEEVVSLWGKTPLITTKTVDGKAVEIWEYHFLSSSSACSIIFSQERVVSTQCQPLQREGYGYAWQSGQGTPGAPPGQQKLVREGFFAMRLAEALKVGEFKGEAEAESKLASLGVLPKNGWIADYPLTPNVIAELENAIGEAADSGKIAMKRDEALKVFKDVIVSIENEYAQAEPPPGNQPYSESYVSPDSIFTHIIIPIHIRFTLAVIIVSTLIATGGNGGSRFFPSFLTARWQGHPQTFFSQVQSSIDSSFMTIMATKMPFIGRG